VTIIALAFLAAASDVIIFHPADIAKPLQAAVANPSRFFELAIAQLSGLALLCLLIILRRLAYRGASFVRYLWTPTQPYDGLELKDRINFENDLRANRIQVITTVVQALGGIAVLIGIYFAWANLKTTQEAQRDTQNSQKETIQITNEGQITDRFTKAIDQLGSPQLELRLGGIYALERIARDSEKDHWPIMEVLTTFVRVNAPIAKTSDQPSKPHGTNPPSSHKANSPSAVPVAVPSPDVQTILTVIGRRDPSFEKGENDRLNLTETNLTGADLYGANLTDAYLKGSTVTQSQVDSALGDKDTVLPQGIVMPELWKHPTAAATTAGSPKSP
jgi:hypothetical protein